MSLNRPDPPPLAPVAQLLAMDRTTLTAAMKPLERRGLVEVLVNESDKRSRLLVLTDAGREALVSALPIWRATHEAVEAQLHAPDGLRRELIALA